MREFEVDLDGTIYSTLDGHRQVMGVYQDAKEEIDLYLASKNCPKICLTLGEMVKLVAALKRHKEIYDELFML